MKKLFLGFLALATLTFSGCNEADRLASKVAGTWSSTPQMLVNDAGSQATIVESVTFERDSDKAGGTVVFTGMISCTGAMTGSDAVVQPFEMAASARSTVTGQWTAVDDDEIMLSLDIDKMTVDVDPSALVISGNVLSGSTESNPETLKPQMAAMVQAALRRQLVARYTSMNRLDDVDLKDKDTVLKFEVGKKDYVYTSQAPMAK
ncbi:MAG: hypothetical protein NC338_01705 [Firmicutes bacterium]|nr:hypothetical protein [Bacillota bacterium]MCM1401189.1 hypothetical protein [Bacteroides sp.]MCM1477114.1 hypothetical protein [Bacteroides sp.]